MEIRASFLSLCAHSFVWWLLTNALGAGLLYVRFELLVASISKRSISGFMDLLLASFIIPSLIATYLTLLWPLFGLLPQWWALTARQPQVRRGRMLLVVLGPFILFTACQWHQLAYEVPEFMLTYPLAAVVSAAWMFRRWLW
jgi:hypothetical protein